MSKMSDVLKVPDLYLGQYELYFDADGDTALSGNAVYILIWRNTKRGIRYCFKKQEGEWLE